MKQGKVRILSTILLEQPLVDKAAANGIDMDMAQFIQINPVNNPTLEKEINALYKQSVTVVFTSVNAVNAVAYYKPAILPDWKIYCIGNTTKASIVQSFASSAIAGTANDAAQLAEVIINDTNNKEVIFFCGDKRRDELLDKLRSKGIVVSEIVVYNTLETPVKIEQQYDGVLFFSPSGVNSFFTKNDAQAGTTFFAIGQTTAAALKKFTNNLIVVSYKQGKEAMIDLAIEYYHKQEVTNNL